MSKVNPLGGGGKGKKLLGIAALAFVGYLLFSNPTGLADGVNSGANGVGSAGNSISTFVEHLDLSGGGQS